MVASLFIKRNEISFLKLLLNKFNKYNTTTRVTISFLYTAFCVVIGTACPDVSIAFGFAGSTAAVLIMYK